MALKPTIYKGQVDVDQLATDAKLLDLGPSELIAAAMPLPGRNGLDYFAIHPIAFAEAYLEGGFYEDVRSVIAQWLAQNPGAGSQSPTQQRLYNRALWVLARAEEADRRYEEATRVLERLLSRAPRAGWHV